MFAGQMACEALNWVLKRYIKEDRPRGMVVEKPIIESMLTSIRNAWKRLRYAFIARAIRLLLLRHPHAVSPLPARAASDRHPHTLHLWWSLPPLARRFGMCGSRSRQPHISQLSYKQASYCRCSSWRRLCICLVWLYDISEKSWMD
jgi:hypothetical protein